MTPPAWLLAETLGKGTALLALATLGSLALRARHPGWRLALIRLAACGLLLLPCAVATLPPLSVPAPTWLSAPSPATPLAPEETIDLQPTLSPITHAPASGPDIHRPSATPWTLSHFLLLIWLSGVTLLAIRHAAGILAMTALRKRANPAPAALCHRATALARALDCSSTPSLLLSRDLTTPILTGLLRPALILPAHLAVPPADLDPILAHELAHAARHDLRWRLLLQATAALWWFHPLAWILHRQHDRAAEERADTTAVQTLGDLDTYRRTLAQVALRTHAWYIAAALPMASPSTLVQRLKNLPLNLRRRPLTRPGLTALALLVSLITLAGSALAWHFAVNPWPIDHAAAPFLVRCLTADGTPVPGARVYLNEVHGQGSMDALDTIPPMTSRGPLVTDARGLVAFDHPITFSDGKSFRALVAVLPGQLAGGASFSGDATDSKTDAPRDIIMHPTTTIRGRVTLPGGNPAAATVRLLLWANQDYSEVVGMTFYGQNQAEPWPELFIRHPDADGRFTFTDIPENRQVDLSVTAPGCAENQSRDLAKPGENLERKITLEPEATLHGAVLDQATGQPIPSALVSIRAPNSLDRRPLALTTDSRGAFQARHLASGTCSIRARASDGRTMQAQRVTLHPGDAKTVTLTVQPTATIAGVVTLDGRPVPFLSVLADDATATGDRLARAMTDADGKYHLQIPDGRTALHLSSLRSPVTDNSNKSHLLVIEHGQLTSGSPDFHFTSDPSPPSVVPPTLTLAGRVLDETNHPAAGVLVLFTTYSKKDGAYTRKIGLTDAAGHYEIKVPGENHYVIATGGIAENTTLSQKITPQPGELLHPVEDLHIRPATAQATGTVLDPTGAPMPNVSIRTHSAHKYSFLAPGTLSDATGHFRLDHLLPDEPFTLEAFKPGYQPLELKDLPPDTSPLTLHLFPSDP